MWAFFVALLGWFCSRRMFHTVHPSTCAQTNGPEFVAVSVRGRIGVKTLYIEPGSPWENRYCESARRHRTTPT